MRVSERQKAEARNETGHFERVYSYDQFSNPQRSWCSTRRYRRLDERVRDQEQRTGIGYVVSFVHDDFYLVVGPLPVLTGESECKFSTLVSRRTSVSQPPQERGERERKTGDERKRGRASRCIERSRGGRRKKEEKRNTESMEEKDGRGRMERMKERRGRRNVRTDEGR
jgi:hypothetical protein